MNIVQDRIAQVRKQWQPVIQAIISAADWGGNYASEVEPFLAQMDEREEWRPLGSVFSRIIVGERDAAVLLAGLEIESLWVAADVLRALGVEIPESSLIPPPDESEEDLSPVIEELIGRVAHACQPDTPLVYSEQVYDATLKMASHPKLPQDLRDLGRVLNLILRGERNPDLAGLSPYWTTRVHELLARTSF